MVGPEAGYLPFLCLHLMVWGLSSLCHSPTVYTLGQFTSFHCDRCLILTMDNPNIHFITLFHLVGNYMENTENSFYKNTREPFIIRNYGCKLTPVLLLFIFPCKVVEKLHARTLRTGYTTCGARIRWKCMAHCSKIIVQKEFQDWGSRALNQRGPLLSAGLAAHPRSWPWTSQQQKGLHAVSAK